MSQLRPGQIVSFRQDITDEEWTAFKESVGLIRGRIETIKLLRKSGIVKGKSESFDAYRIQFDNNPHETWLIPKWAIITTPIDKMQAIKDKIKYLDQRYVTRHCKEPVPQVSTDW